MGEQMSPNRTAERFGHNRDFWVALVKAGELRARDERPPGAKLPRYVIDADDVERWRESRVVSPTLAGSRSVVPAAPRVVRVSGVLARMREAKRVRRAAAPARV